jgi:hypothetical protein
VLAIWLDKSVHHEVPRPVHEPPRAVHPASVVYLRPQDVAAVPELVVMVRAIQNNTRTKVLYPPSAAHAAPGSTPRVGKIQDEYGEGTVGKHKGAEFYDSPFFGVDMATLCFLQLFSVGVSLWQIAA